MIKGFIFDFNGTLFFDSPLHVIAWDTIAHEIGSQSVDANFLETKLSGLPNKEILKLLKDPSIEIDYEAYSLKKEAQYRKAALAMRGGPHLVKGAEEVFDFLKENHIPFTIASASIKENIDFFVETFHLDKWIDPATIIYDDGSYTDKVDMFLDACAVLNIDPSSILIFEDSVSGISCAEKIGASIIAMDSPSLRTFYPEHPSIIKTIHSFEGLIPTLQTLIGESNG